MARYHVNPNTGETGVCRASGEGRGCPFGGESDHYDSASAAREAYEVKASQEYASTGIKKAPVSSNGRLFGDSGARSLVGSLVGKDYESVIANAKARAQFASKPRRTAGLPAAVPANSKVAGLVRAADRDARKAEIKASILASTEARDKVKSATDALRARRSPYLAGAKAMLSN